MNKTKRVLIVKHGALGDVVRTQYFAKSIKEKYKNKVTIYWWIAEESSPLIRYNPHIDIIVINVESIKSEVFDCIYSLEDEKGIVEVASKIKHKDFVGAYLKDAGINYTDNSAIWFDMGLLSRYGLDEADKLKKTNNKTHSEIFSKIFDVSTVSPSFYGNKIYETKSFAHLKAGQRNIGVNAFAGKRWPAKSLHPTEYKNLVVEMARSLCANGIIDNIYLIGNGLDYEYNARLCQELKYSCIKCVFTGNHVLQLAAVVKGLSLLVTSDSLALHLAIAQGIPSVSFYTATSAAEIDTFGTGTKVKSRSKDYCNYKPNADNSSITAKRLFREVKKRLNDE